MKSARSTNLSLPLFINLNVPSSTVVSLSTSVIIGLANLCRKGPEFLRGLVHPLQHVAQGIGPQRGGRGQDEVEALHGLVYAM